MENQIQSNNTNICLVLMYMIYSTIHLLIIIYFFGISHVSLKRNYNFIIFIFLLCIFTSFLLTAIFVFINYMSNRRKLLYICLIPSLINELIFIGLLIFCIIYLVKNTSGSTYEDFMIFVIVTFLIESLPNFILFIHICRKSKNKRIENLENINDSSLLNKN